MSANLPTIALFAKFPVPGLAKTRLIPALGAHGAAQLHRVLVERTIAVIRQSGLPFAVWTTGAEPDKFARWLGADVTLVEQGEGDLGARLARVPAPTILLGADVPDLRADHLAQAARQLAQVPAVIGPAADGGYYLLGLQRQMPFLFAKLDWGTDAVLAETLRLLAVHQVAYRLLDELADCDRPEDLGKWPELAR